jgi:hypothetical protein
MSATYDHKHYGICKEHEKFLEFESPAEAADWIDRHNRDYHSTEWMQAKMEEQSAFAWDQGFTAACDQWSKQGTDPTHPITRTNPYAKDGK